MSFAGESFLQAERKEQTENEREVGVFERSDVREATDKRDAVWGGDGGEDDGVVEEGVRVFRVAFG